MTQKFGLTQAWKSTMPKKKQKPTKAPMQVCAEKPPAKCSAGVRQNNAASVELSAATRYHGAEMEVQDK